ncbi:MAG TPA: DUF4177 domain-containing protein [Candidatus Angelobacter sp.]
MQNWEYTTRDMSKNPGGSHVQEFLNEMGKEGWELIQIMSGDQTEEWANVRGAVVAIFKRPIEE